MWPIRDYIAMKATTQLLHCILCGDGGTKGHILLMRANYLMALAVPGSELIDFSTTGHLYCRPGK